MYVLILLVCQGLACNHFKVLEVYTTFEACEAGMVKFYSIIESGQGLLCVRDDRAELNT
jgi:hypothetical protein